MSNLIDRQAAISAICNACGKIDCDKMDKCEKLQLPPTNCSEIPNNSDTISREAVADAINGIECTRHTTWYEFYQKVMTAVEKFPPAEHGANLASLGTDCISRQAAIETFKDCAVNGVGIDGIVDALEQLSPIQPEIVRCGECEYCVHHPSTPNTKRPCDPPQPEMWHCGKNREFKPRVMPHDFCSRGKRREVTT